MSRPREMVPTNLERMIVGRDIAGMELGFEVRRMGVMLRAEDAGKGQLEEAILKLS